MAERVTLITGASAGIGADLARVFAKEGHRVALTARRADRLCALADEIAAAGGRAPILIPCDLQAPDAGDKIAAALAEAGVEVEYLVNNAGFGLFGNAAELAPKGVRVTVLCPGPVLTEFQVRAGFQPGFDSTILNVSPSDVARQAYDGLMANKRAVLPGLGIKIVPLLLRLFPRGFILWAVGRFQQRKR